MRWLLAGRGILFQLKATYSPNRVNTLKYEGRPVGEDVISGVISFFVFYTATFAFLAFLLELMGLDFMTASSGVLTALANVGPGVGSVIGPAGNFATLSDPVKLIFVLAMLLGRLEMLTVYVLLTNRFWQESLP